MPGETLHSSSSASRTASIGATSSSSKAKSMPVTVTQCPEPRILYEPCVRPSGVRSCRSHSVGKCCHLRADPDVGNHDANLTEMADKWVQTQLSSLTVPSSVTEAPGGNREVVPAAATAQQLQPMRHRSPPPSGEGQMTRSASRDSLNTWPPSEQTPRQLSVKPRKPRVPAVVESKQGQAVRPKDSPVPTKKARDMPQLDWSSRPCTRGSLQLRRVLRRRAVFLVDIDFAAIMTIVLVFGLVAMATSALQRLLWPDVIMDDWVPFQPHPN